MNEIRNLRKEYSASTLDICDVDASPFAQLEKWIKEAIKAEVLEPHAMCLSTVSAEGRPSSRIVLLRVLHEGKMGFFTNYRSRKASELGDGANVALNFFWAELERQVRIEGKVYKSSVENSDMYFQSRPPDSQIGAWASPQSQKLKDRAELEKLISDTQANFKNEPIPRPEFWGGYEVVSEAFEFWQGRPSRLHDRILYEMLDGHWQLSRLAP